MADPLGLNKSIDRLYSHLELNEAVSREREACAKIADVKVDRPWPETAVEAAREISARIRARGNRFGV